MAAGIDFAIEKIVEMEYHPTESQKMAITNLFVMAFRRETGNSQSREVS
ncbi:MAG: hypothetical protein SXA11_01175 [Cyanobacteriota bacterium]|nr:hypothetical protein [Cyanobacteriota bacterium]